MELPTGDIITTAEAITELGIVPIQLAINSLLLVGMLLVFFKDHFQLVPMVNKLATVFEISEKHTRSMHDESTRIIEENSEASKNLATTLNIHVKYSQKMVDALDDHAHTNQMLMHEIIALGKTAETQSSVTDKLCDVTDSINSSLSRHNDLFEVSHKDLSDQVLTNGHIIDGLVEDLRTSNKRIENIADLLVKGCMNNEENQP